MLGTGSDAKHQYSSGPKANAGHGRQGPITFPYEKYGSTHPIQLKVSAYMDGNLAIAMHTWENGYAEPGPL